MNEANRLKPARLLLPASLLAEMLEHARSELPNECCGLLIGRREGELGVIEHRLPLVNALASPREFLSEPSSLFAAIREMRRQGLEEIAIYHSHPTSAPVPSHRDREMNYAESVANFIVGLQESEPIVRAWWLTAEVSTEARWEVLPEI